MELTVGQVKIKRAWIDDTWNNRVLSAANIKWPKEVATTTTRSPQKASRASAPRSSKTNKKLTGTGFVISLSPSEKDTERRKNQLASTLTELGAINVDDWTKLFTLDGRIVNNNQHWRGKFSDVSYEGQRLDRLFLLAEGETTKPRYIFALAFGIPCLKVTCVEDFKKNVGNSYVYSQRPPNPSLRD
jgi:hypothetical protein